ncbi:AsnC family transcriptional regulator [Sphingobium herbicidovorans NBRC 16415]|uniref:AsnC family transcriptional regulator n=1 Tax=Sphingobium herbicidovorans (strain ATCC 700291 / DSM 11019 / CCUG 56400 / KCTC 2939 / LMG 18315 / NBRC 16415 / MH) TaxID=1219045 RepID=A0A086PEY6_SPHHM|nr:Lrp/AsnC family transcriptional regulator [Sphingobium herbicidovorans]KFG91954.1 AsnC family transcriptional regulator [Sphingobium herbicidovorans NBRC 16415]
MSRPDLDELDHQLIDILAQDARVSNRKIASELGVNEGTVRGRIKRLQQEKLIAFTALTGLKLEKATNVAFIAVQADVGHVRQIARDIAHIALVKAVMITLGPFNIMATCLYDDLDDLHKLASGQILAMEGVNHVETSLAVRTVKFSNRVVRITDVQAGSGL